MMNNGESANPHYLVIECSVCGESFLLPKAKLEKLCAAQTHLSR